MIFHTKVMLFLLITASLGACVSYDFSQRTVHQGNLLSQSNIAKLHVGMSKTDVAILMGTSLLSQSFNPNRWDYIYDIRRGGNSMHMQRLSLYFRHNVITRIVMIP